jgi:hypothetical protein
LLWLILVKLHIDNEKEIKDRYKNMYSLNG